MSLLTARKSGAGLSRGDVSIANYLGGLYGKPGSEADTYAGVSGLLDPLVQRITGESRARTKASLADLAGLTKAYATQLGSFAPAIEKDYAGAKQQSEAAGSGLADYLKNLGESDAADVGGKLAAAGLPSEVSAAAATRAGGVGKGASGETAAQGFANKDYLIGTGKNNVSYARLLPGFGVLEGQRQGAKLSGDAQAALQAQLDSVYGQVPGLVDSARNRASSERQARASGIGGFLTSTLDRNAQTAIAKAGLGKDAAGRAIDWTVALGYKTDAQGNPVYDAQGNLIPSERTVAAAGSASAKDKKARTTAVRNRENAKLTAAKAVETIVRAEVKPVYETVQVPEVVAGVRTGRFVTHKVKKAAPGFQQLYQLAISQPEVYQLKARYGLTDADLRQIVLQGLRAAGITPPKAKPKATGNSRYDNSGRPG